MMRLRSLVILVAAAALVAVPAAALARLSLSVGVTPTSACPGDWVTVSGSLHNIGTTDQIVTVTASGSYLFKNFGPYSAKRPLAAGQGYDLSYPIQLPSFLLPGNIHGDVSATDSDGTVSDSGDLQIKILCFTEGSDPAPALAAVAEALRRLCTP